MSTELIKSPSQLKYEAEKTEQELVSLLKNWKKKKSTLLTKLQVFRTEIKELDAVLAETELGYQAYQALLSPLASIATNNPVKLDQTLQTLTNQHLELSEWITSMLQAAGDLSSFNTNTETNRVFRARELHKNNTAHLRHKSREVYVALKTEKQSVADYAAHLTTLIQEKKAQFLLQIKTDGIGL
ncbi:hypothetical protein [Adhaeribacter pallidiroseus]|uniref:Uncharacterized protein n=1 Tax=Adhaeribacter pallidiroseus TaxID=2072847 RepID=A0A369QPJ8_9BACT|nr:hypothetical protein [Adhaeribacter pallidiroseus]RDC66310.1 hypothetical protein AHMF7616_04941 [Adhaeribacter pallidiroseus]